MLKTIALQPDSLTKNVASQPVVKRVQIKANRRSYEIIAAAEAQAASLIADAQEKIENAISRGFGFGFNHGCHALVSYFMDSQALNQALLNMICEELQQHLQSLFVLTPVIEQLISSIISKEMSFNAQKIQVHLPEQTQAAASAIKQLCQDAGLLAEIDTHHQPGRFAISWGEHHWELDTQTIAKKMLNEIMQSIVSPKKWRESNRLQTAEALKKMAAELEEGILTI